MEFARGGCFDKGWPHCLCHTVCAGSWQREIHATLSVPLAIFRMVLGFVVLISSVVVLTTAVVVNHDLDSLLDFWASPDDGSVHGLFRPVSASEVHSCFRVVSPASQQVLLAHWSSDSLAPATTECTWTLHALTATSPHWAMDTRQHAPHVESAANGSHSAIVMATPCVDGGECASARPIQPLSIRAPCLQLGQTSSAISLETRHRMVQVLQMVETQHLNFSTQSPLLAYHVVQEGFELPNSLAPVGGWELMALETGALCRDEPLPAGWRLPTVIGFGGSLIGGLDTNNPVLDSEIDYCWFHDYSMGRIKSLPSWDSVRLSALLRLQGEMLAQEMVAAPQHDKPECPFLPKVFAANERSLGRDWPANGLTMVGTVRLGKAQAIFEHLAAKGLEGDVVETGVWRGGASLFMKSILQMRCVALGLAADCTRRVWLFDSFEGLPPVSHNDDIDFVPMNNVLAVSLDQVVAPFVGRHITKRVAGAGAPCHVSSDNGKVALRREGDVLFVKGFFNESARWAMNVLSQPETDAAKCAGTQTHPFDKIALLRLDGDMYISSMDILFELGPLLQVGGFLFNDDYTVPGQALSMTHFRMLVGWKAPIVHVGDIMSVYFEIDRKACISPAMRQWQASGYLRSQFAAVVRHSGPEYCE